MTTTFPRIRRRLKRLGFEDEVQIATNARTQREHNQRVALFDQLIEHAQVSVIKALLAGDTNWGELIDHRRRHKGAIGADALGDIELNRALWPAFDAAIPTMGGKNPEETRARYGSSRGALERKAGPMLGEAPKVRDLLTLDWPTLRSSWGTSAADWNHVLRTTMAFASKYRGKRSQFAVEVRALLTPLMLPEPPRVADISVAVFQRVVEKARPDIRPYLYVLALTGMRVDEYLGCTRMNLRPETRQLVVPGTKTAASHDILAFSEEDWAFIVAGIPCRLKYRRLYTLWEKACVAAGAGEFIPTGKYRTRKLPMPNGRPKAGVKPRTITEEVMRYKGLRLHDLRHFCATVAGDAGVSLTDIRAQLRHTNISQTEKYMRRGATMRVAATVGRALREGEGTR
jgi:integrase